MIDTSNIPILDVINQLCCIAWQKPVRARGEMVYKGGPCPFCRQGEDRFAVFIEGEKPHFYCGIHGTGCEEGGDVITFVRLVKGYKTNGEAMRDLRAMGYEVGDGSVANFSPSLIEKGAPVAAWQAMGKSFVHEAEKCLWSPAGKASLDHLYKRGLTDEIIRLFHIGYCPKWTEHQREAWGLSEGKNGESTFWIRPGIVIPTFEKDTLWKINIRIWEYTPKELTEAKETGKELPRYRQVLGSSNSLFNVDTLVPGSPIFMTEGEFDAMLGQQETGFSFVATGSTGGSQMAHWIARLSRASHLFLAFDNDGGKGEKAASDWLALFGDEKATLWLPNVNKDVTDMWLQKRDIKGWATKAINLIAYTPEEDYTEPIPSELPEVGNSDTSGQGEHVTDAGNMIPSPVPTQPVDPLAGDRVTGANNPIPTFAKVVCRALWHLNTEGKPCGAREKPHAIVECGGTFWIWSSEDNARICFKCLTPESVQMDSLLEEKVIA